MINFSRKHYHEHNRSTKDIVDEMFIATHAKKVSSMDMFKLRIFCIPINKNWSIKTQIIISLMILYLVSFLLTGLVLGVNN